MKNEQRVVFAISFIAFFAAACVASQRLSPTDRNEFQPIMSSTGAVLETSHPVVKRVTGQPTNHHVITLVDAVRESLDSPLFTGNKVVTLIDGPATFAAIDSAIAQARHHVHVETYILADDDLGQRFAQLLKRKRAEGVEIRVIYDAVGSIQSSGEFFDSMRDAGIEVIEFRPINPVRTFFWRFHNRDHRKVIVVDGRTAFTGGLNISRTYSSASTAAPGPEEGLEEGWRDTHVQITGPVVKQFQLLFLDTWQQLGGKPAQSIDTYYPDLKPVGDQLVAVAASQGAKEKDEAIYHTYLAAIRNSGHRVWITQAYFLPPVELRDALIQAAQRGVDVRILVPGFTDSKLTLHASRREYTPLLEGGVRLIEKQHALLHAKTALIDDSLSIIGSANLDYRSFLHNNEITAIVIGDSTAQHMHATFVRDAKAGKELTLMEWEKRPLWQRMIESVSGLAKYWL
jgi:cardiolipin synthase